MMTTSTSETTVEGAQLAKIYRLALTARRFEEVIIRLAAAGEVPSTLHAGAGQEVCQVAALSALSPTDPMLYGHRGVGYWIARGVPLDVILCDLTGREGGSNAGQGGIMHVIDTERGVIGQSGTLGGNFVIGVGIALADKRLCRNTVTIMFFGDGTSNRGQFHEALNFAALQRLPCIFFCENNGWGLSVPAELSTSVADIAERAHGYGIPGVVVDGTDAAAVREVTEIAADRARSGLGPSLIEAKVHRLHGHYLGDPERYRSEEDRSLAATADPLLGMAEDLLGRGVLTTESMVVLEEEIALQIERGVSDMRQREFVRAKE
jgi:TPP-dependent pyruvate/acetoin dehydrogenase alpha subunit